MTITGNFERFRYFETNFLKNESLFQKGGVPLFWLKVRIENTTFPYKTALSEANVKANRMGSTRWTYHKKRSFASKYFSFLKILFQFNNQV